MKESLSPLLSRINFRKGAAPTIERSFVDLGEPIFDQDNKCLLVGDGTGKAQKVAELIVGPHDESLYAKLDGHEKYIPIVFPNFVRSAS